MLGNDFGIVCEDVNIKEVVLLIVIGLFFNGGQMCVCMKCIYVYEFIYDEFFGELVSVVEMNFGIKKDFIFFLFFGLFLNRMQFEIVFMMLVECKFKKFNIVLGGCILNEGGYWIELIIIFKLDEDFIIVQKE